MNLQIYTGAAVPPKTHVGYDASVVQQMKGLIEENRKLVEEFESKHVHAPHTK